MKPMQKIHGEL